MRRLRVAVSWYFAFASILFLWAACADLADIHHGPSTLTRFLNAMFALAFFVAGVSVGNAWWLSQKSRPLARRWGIIASALCLLIFLGTPFVLYFLRGRRVFIQVEQCFWLPTIIGIAVLMIFALPAKEGELRIRGSRSNGGEQPTT
jgi:hypothetical protein